jgi:hypothetical protein
VDTKFGRKEIAMSARKTRPKKTEYRERTYNITRRLTVFEDKPEELEVHSSLLGYPIRFTLTEELREFLRTL